MEGNRIGCPPPLVGGQRRPVITAVVACSYLEGSCEFVAEHGPSLVREAPRRPSQLSEDSHVRRTPLATERRRRVAVGRPAAIGRGVVGRHGRHEPGSGATPQGASAGRRSADFFDVDEFPTLTFESTRVEPIDDDSSYVVGNLTMHGVTREVRLKAVVEGTDIDPWGNERVGLEVTGVLTRSDVDMKFNQALGSGNVLVGDKVNVSLDISAVKQ